MDKFLGLEMKMESRVEKIITFQGEIKGKVVIGISWLKKLEPKEINKLSTWEVFRFCHRHSNNFRIRVLLDGNPTGIYLELIHLLDYARIIFEYLSMDDGTLVLGAFGKTSSGQTVQFRELEVDVIGEVPLRQETRATRDSVPAHRTSTTHAGGSESISHLPNGSNSAADIPSIVQRLGDGSVRSAKRVLPSNGATGVLTPLEYHKPSTIRGRKLVATISTSDVQPEIQRWENAIVGFYCVGRNTQGVNNRAIDVKHYIKKKWTKFGPFKTYELQPPGFFMFNFKHGADKYKLLQHSQWLIDNRPFILKCWTPNLQLDPVRFLAKVPIWVKFPSLDLQFWSKTSLERISSLIGEPLFADESTSRHERLQYARVCIEIKLRAKLPKSVLISTDGDHNVIEQAVEYEWKPQPCSFCSSLAHESSACALAKGTLTKSHSSVMNEAGQNLKKVVKPKGNLKLLTMMCCTPGNSPDDVQEIFYEIRRRN